MFPRVVSNRVKYVMRGRAREEANLILFTRWLSTLFIDKNIISYKRVKNNQRYSKLIKNTIFFGNDRLTNTFFFFFGLAPHLGVRAISKSAVYRIAARFVLFDAMETSRRRVSCPISRGDRLSRTTALSSGTTPSPGTRRRPANPAVMRPSSEPAVASGSASQDDETARSNAVRPKGAEIDDDGSDSQCFSRIVPANDSSDPPPENRTREYPEGVEDKQGFSIHIWI